MIAVFFASRGRPDLFKTAYRAVLDLADNPDDIFIALRIDQDDHYLNSYVPILRNRDEIVVGSKTGTQTIISVAHLYEELYVRFNNCDIYVCLNDDTICRTPAWDKQLVEHFNQLNSKVGAVRLGDGYNVHAVLFAKTRGWIEAFGSLFTKGISGGEDTYLHDLGMCLRSSGYERHFVDRMDIVFEHVHPMFGTRQQDATDRANNILRRDTHGEYLNRLNEIPNDLQKLISAIKGSN